MNRTIVVTGASRGIGRAIATAYAASGTRLVLLGRDEAGLAGTAGACRARGAAVETIAIDIRDRAGLADRLRALDDRTPVDLLVANAGVALPAADDAALVQSSYGEFDVNVGGALNTVLPLLDRMTGRGRGQIAFLSSLAAFAPLSDAPGYSGSKAALLVYGLALRQRLRPRGVKVSVVCPGYVATDMGARYAGWRPLEMSPDRAASHVLRGLARDRAVIAFPWPLALVARLSTFVPESWMRLGLSLFRFDIARGG